MIAAVVLAAGASRRLGRPKQLVSVEGESLLRRAAGAALEAGCRPVVVVLGREAERMRREIEGLAVEVVVNDEWSEGVGASVRTGVGVVEERAPQVRSVVLVACDQPALTADVLRRLCSAWDGSPGGLVACAYAGTVGVPALFGRERFAELRALAGDRGAKIVLARHPERVARVDWPVGAKDVDHPEDLAGGGLAGRDL
jgi:molybdenum cofactor cytidylyltransferase